METPNFTYGGTYGNRVKLTWPRSVGPRLTASRHCSATNALWLMPNLEPPESSDQKPPEPPKILVVWWLTLFALSIMARYHPAEWAQVCDFDNSPLAVPTQALLAESLEALPKLVLAALDDPSRHRSMLP